MVDDHTIKKITHDDYNQFTSSNNCSVFQKVNWLDSSTLSKHYSKVYLGGFKRSQMVGVCAFVLKSFCFLHVVGSPMKGLYTEIGGPVFLQDIPRDDIQAFVSEFNDFVRIKYNPIFFQFSPDFFSPVYESIVPMIGGRLNLRERIDRSALIDPRESSEDVWKQLEGRARTAIRKARNNNVSVSCVDGNEGSNLIAFYDLYRATFDRRGLKPRHNYMFFQNMFKGLDPSVVRLVLAKHEQEVVSAAIFVKDRDRVVYLAGASSEKGLRYSAQSLVLWNCIEYCTSKKLKFDLGGLGDAGIDKFKESFGGDVYQKPNYIYANRIVSWIVHKVFGINLN